ncbi:MAG: multidrug effflux MFS transporter [Pseudomonadota bacterium]
MTDFNVSTAQATGPDRVSKVPALWLLVGLSSVGPLALNIFQPSIGAIASDFAVPSSQVQWSLTVYLVGLMIGQFIYGPLSDRFGRRPLILLGLFGFIFANTWLALTNDFTSLLLGRGLQAMAASSGMVLTRAIVRDCYPTEKSASALGYVTTAMVAVPAIAPSLGYGLEYLGSWRYGFWFLVAFGTWVGVTVWRFVPETNLSPLHQLSLKGYVQGSSDLLLNRPFIAYCGTLGFGTASFFCFLAGAPYATVEVLGGSGKEYSLYFLILSAGYMAGNFTAGRFSVRLGLPLMMRIGHGVSLLAGVVFMFNLATPSMLLIFVPAALVAFGGGLYNPAAMAGALAVRPDIAGTASALIGVLSMGMAVAFSVLTNLVMGPSLLGFVLPYAACIIGASLCSYVAINAGNQRRSELLQV